MISEKRATKQVGFVGAGLNGDVLPEEQLRAAARQGKGVSRAVRQTLQCRRREQRAGLRRFVDRTPTERIAYRVTRGPGVRCHAEGARRRSRRSDRGPAASSCRGSTSGRRRLSPRRAGDRAIAAVVADPPQGAQGIDEQTSVRHRSSSSTRPASCAESPGHSAARVSGRGDERRVVRDMVFVHANAGKVMNRYTLTEGALHPDGFSRRWPTRSGRKATSFRAC